MKLPFFTPKSIHAQLVDSQNLITALESALVSARANHARLSVEAHAHIDQLLELVAGASTVVVDTHIEPVTTTVEHTEDVPAITIPQPVIVPPIDQTGSTTTMSVSGVGTIGRQ